MASASIISDIERRQTLFERAKEKDIELLGIYEKLLLPRIIEEKMLSLLRQGKISKWFSGIGQEAVAVSAALALNDDEFILPMHRNLGVFTTRGIPMERLFGQFQGKASGFTKGRDRSFHFGSKEFNIVGMISHLGPQLGVADGIALRDKIQKEKKCTIVFSGDGATSEGDFHESVNLAAVWDLPVIILVENNGYALSTPNDEQFRCALLSDKAIGYGIESHVLPGNNILEVSRSLKKIAASIRRRPRPVLVECMTFRRRGHEEASGTKYVPKALMEEWEAKDPVDNYEKWLLAEGVLNDKAVETTRKRLKDAVNAAVKTAFDEPDIEVDRAQELADVYSNHGPIEIAPEGNSTKEMRFIDALTDALRESMLRHDSLVLMGQDIGTYGGVFKITDGFTKQFGKGRVRNTPLCESAVLGAGFGYSINGGKAMVEMQFADFVSEGMTQICNNIAKAHWRWGQNADVVIRMPTGAGSGAGPFHSQSNEAWFFKIPGLKIVYPSNPADAKGLLCAAIEDPDPVMFFEHKVLYRSLNGVVPEGFYTTPIGKATTVQEGEDLTFITYGMGVHWAMDVINELPEASIELIDLRTLLPWDQEAVLASVKKTGKALVLHEDTLTGGIGAEIAAVINEACFQWLDAPVKRIGSMDTAVPFNQRLEAIFLPKDGLFDQVKTFIES